MRQAATYLQAGIGLTASAFLVATVISLVVELDWLLVFIIVMVIISAAALVLTVTPTPSSSSEIGGWTLFANVWGEGFNVIGSGLTGGRTGVDRQPPSWNPQAIVNGAFPLLIFIVLLVIWFVR